MKQFLLSSPPSPQDDSLELNGRDFHYLCHVRRLSAGDRIQARDGEGTAYILELTGSGPDSCRFSIIERKEKTGRENWKITLFQALPKGKKMDQIVRQATEAGVTAIVPLESEHSLVKLNTPKDRQTKRERWERIVREALQQSGSSLATTVDEPAPFSRLRDFPGPGRLGLFCHQDLIGDGLLLPPLSSVEEPLEEVGILIGPEGGLSVREVDNLKKWGYDSVWFGDNVLRAETASVYAVAAVRTILRELF